MSAPRRALVLALAVAAAAPGTSPPIPRGPAPAAPEREGKHDQRADWFFGRRAFPNGIPDGAYERALAQAAALEDAALPAGPGQGLTWRALGPQPIARTTYDPHYQGRGPISGRVSRLALHPTDADVAYAGTAGGGIWKTTDGGATWDPLTDDLPSLNIGAIALDPNDPDVVYAGSGEADAWWFTPPGRGIFKSTDGGTTWADLPSPFARCSFADLAVMQDGTVLASVHGGGDLYRAAGLPRPARCPRDGVWRSADGGATWSRTLSGVAWDIELDPLVPSRSFATVESVGIFRSTDSGATWSQMRAGLPAAGFERIALASSKAARLYAVFVVPLTGNMLGIWASDDGGETWLVVPTAQDPCSYSEGSPGQCYYDITAVVDPSDGVGLFVGGIRLWRYPGFSPLGRELGYGSDGIHVDQHALAVDAAGRVWVGNDGGIYRTTDGGATFENLNDGLALTQFYPGISGSLTARLLGGSQDNGTAMYDGSDDWVGVLGGDGAYSAVDPRNADVLWGSYQNLSVQKSTDGGERWRAVPIGAPPTEPREFIAPFTMHPTEPDTLYAGTVRLYRTTDGARWAAASPLLDGATITAIGPAPSDTGTVYVGTRRGGCFVTRDGGATWRNTAAGLPGTVPTDFAVDPDRPEIAYAALSGYGRNVYATRDGGGSWQNISGNLPEAPANAIAFDDRTEVLYAGTDVGLFSSADGGATWRPEHRGLPKAVVMDLLIDRASSSLIAATHGRGMYATTL